jgi:hypothetical protein
MPTVMTKEMVQSLKGWLDSETFYWLGTWIGKAPPENLMKLVQQAQVYQRKGVHPEADGGQLARDVVGQILVFKHQLPAGGTNVAPSAAPDEPAPQPRKPVWR